MTSGEHPRDTPAPTAWRQLAPLIDLVTPMAVRVAATLRLADLLTDTPRPVHELAQESGADAQALERLLRHLAFHGMFIEPTPGVFAINETAALLRSDHPSGMQVGLDLGGFGGQMDLVFTELLHTVRTGNPAWERVFGAPFWQYLSENPAMGRSFDAVMAAGAEYLHDDLRAHDWSGVRHVVDVGGGNGALICALLDSHPDMRATLVDLPATVERAMTGLAERGLQDRVRPAGRSFFDPLPPGGDLYVLNSVLHDWPDEQAGLILSRCADAAGRTGRVLIIEEHGAAGGAQAEMDLRMLVLCGGRERSVAQYTALADAAGLAVVDVRSTPLGQVGITCAAVQPGP